VRGSKTPRGRGEIIGTPFVPASTHKMETRTFGSYARSPET